MARLDQRDRPRVGTRGVSTEAAVYRDRARLLGLSFVPFVDLGHRAGAEAPAIRSGTFALSSEGTRLAYLAPDEDSVPAILHWLGRHPSARARLRVSTPTAIRTALTTARREQIAKAAVARLASSHPHLSARRVVSVGQVVFAVALAAGVLAAWFQAPLWTMLAVNLVAAALFFGVTALRFVAAGRAARAPRPVAAVIAPAADCEALPIYSVLIPLRDEAALVPEIVAAIARLDWPRERLDVKILVEADDTATIASAREATRAVPFEIVVIPPVGPRTKPKALAFALPLCRGEFVTVYDAEDRPHPGQLREAVAAFARLPPEVACLQSPLVIDNRRPNWLSRSFAIEYAALFDAMLPALTAFGMPLPLGGTSNHFRRTCLKAAGGWDPFNVTEDADLGIRLARLGYRCGTLDLPTFEDAPTTPGAWFKQRTRWFKGWMRPVKSNHSRRQCQ